MDIKKDNRIVVLLGAGLHRSCSVSTSDDDTQLLAAWSDLIANRNNVFDNKIGYTLLWELNALNQGNLALKASERILVAQTKLAERILELADKSIAANWTPPIELQELLFSDLVTDIVSLNVDLVLERWLAKKIGCALPTARNILSNGKKYGINSSRSRVFQIDNKELRFWYPHGDIAKKSSLQFSLSEYGHSVRWMERARANYKKYEKHDVDTSFSTWLDPILSRHRLLVLGCSLDRSEWDIWFAFVCRWRNFARYRDQVWYPDSAVLTVENNEDHIHLPWDPKLLKPLKNGSDWSKSWSLINDWTLEV
jgi:hypothetical protein